MSQHVAAAELIIQAWKLNWAAGELKDMPVEYENRRFEQPTDIAWARFTYLQGKTEPAAIGKTLDRTPFFKTLQVFIPKNKGTKTARIAADIAAKLNYKTISTGDRSIVAYLSTASLEKGPKEPGFESFNVTIGGHYDSTPTT